MLERIAGVAAIVILIACSSDDGNPAPDDDVPAAYFVSPAAQDFHLVATAANAIDKGIAVPEAGLDMDGVTRGSSPDLGAYELR